MVTYGHFISAGTADQLKETLTTNPLSSLVKFLNPPQFSQLFKIPKAPPAKGTNEAACEPHQGMNPSEVCFKPRGTEEGILSNLRSSSPKAPGVCKMFLLRTWTNEM